VLDKAVAGGNLDARYYLAALLAAGPEADKRDPQRALTLLGEVMHDVDVDPAAFEIRAAAQAMLGRFDEAQKDEKKALSLARKLGWDPKPLQERHDRYAANQSWSGELMVY
jgi:tetratricopeptide (TPR) repeat protein